ncbi:CaiB/BaiF CoA transferase family protein [Pseudaquabacterium pictum]|uniref:CoA transferase n=1 Tax=Pseudaquabacterium pictum TaxID=2315236 RepID=A0A480AQH2_9BURK|nr:CoA transferase [Rubrivivax pictus]GCL60968.1 CoA transferase [Rubrivivax pictus]
MTAAASTDEPLPFQGLKVIDCASFIAAPVAATLLADLGADVVKVEPPGGDPHRTLSQRVGCLADSVAADNNFVWDLNSRHKRSIVLDLKQPAGQAVLHRMAQQADVFITNLPLPVRARLAIDADTLLALNPRLVVASMTAYGETGPEAPKSGFDVTAYWARAGLMDLVRADHTAPPTRPVPGMGDHPSAVTLFAAITTALYRRERTGRGGLVSTSLMANGLWSNAIQVQAQLAGARYPQRLPRSHATNPLSNIYQAGCGRWLSMVILNEPRQLGPLLHTLDLDHLQDDPRLATAASREAHGPDIVAQFDAAFARHDLATWRRKLDAAGITFGVVGTLADMDDDEQMRAAGALVPYGHRAGTTVAAPILLHGSTPRPPGPAPGLGEHSRTLLAEAGYDDAQIAHLLHSGVVQ